MRIPSRRGFTLIELLVVIAIIAILAVVVVLTLNPAQLLAQSRDANRVSDMATLQSALNLYVTDQAGASTFNLGNASTTYISSPDKTLSGNTTSTCSSLGLPSLPSGDGWQCASPSGYRTPTSTGWIPVNFNLISAGSPFGSLPVDPTNQTSSGLYYAYNTNGSQFAVTADLESTKYKSQYGSNVQTSYFPEVISAGTPSVSMLYNPSGLVGYWPLNEGSGSSTIDQSGNGDNGTWSGTPIGSNGTYYTGGKVGAYAGDFNGSNDYVDIGTAAGPQTNSPLTLTGWVNPSVVTGCLYPIIARASTSTGSGYFLGTFGTGCLSAPDFTMRLNNTEAYSSTTYASVGTWYFLAGTFDGSSIMSLYVNGVLQSTSSVTSFSVPSTNHLYIGAGGWAVGGISYEAGFLDDVRLYTRALSPAEVMALYNAEK